MSWNEKDQPIGSGGTTLSSYIGAIVRERVPITIITWRDEVCKEYKEMIWEDVKVCNISLLIRIGGDKGT